MCNSKLNFIYIYISKSWSVEFIIPTLLLSHISSHITYLSKSWSVEFIVTMLMLNQVSSHITYLFSIIFLLFFDSFYLFINVVVYGYIFSNFPPSLLPFISPLLLTLISLFLFPLIILLFWLLLSLSSYYKFAKIFHSIHILSHQKVITLSLSHVFLFFW